jgi:hypothetical protein
MLKRSRKRSRKVAGENDVCWSGVSLTTYWVRMCGRGHNSISFSCIVMAAAISSADILNLEEYTCIVHMVTLLRCY